MDGFIVTWDVDTEDRRQCARLRFFVFGKTVTAHGRVYRYKGFADEDGVRYLGQSVLFVRADRVARLRSFLRSEGISHVISEGTLGRIVV